MTHQIFFHLHHEEDAGSHNQHNSPGCCIQIGGAEQLLHPG